MGRKPSLRTELLFNLAFLAGAALLLGVGTILLASTVAPSPQRAIPFLLLVIAADIAVFIVFGHYIVTRHVLRPVRRLVTVVDAVAGGDLAARAPDAETRDFTLLGERLNRMTDRLLDYQTQLVHAEKLAGIGRLAAGIAHEVGNPLGAIGTYTEVLRRRGGDAEVVQGLTRELERIDVIVRGLLDYAHPHEEALGCLDPREVLERTFRLLEAQGTLRGMNARLDVVGPIPEIRASRHHLEQALVNLVLNAIDAAPGGTIVLGVRAWAYQPGLAAPRRSDDSGTPSPMFERTSPRRPARLEFRPGQDGALLFVADSGPGVAPETRDHIFDPFFTTKPPGQGTGLGLAIVARVVDDSGGVIWVDRAREGGAIFKMFFPSASQ